MYAEKRREDFFLHPRMLSDLIPRFRYVVAEPGASENFYLRVRYTAHQRAATLPRHMSFQVPHGVPAGFVGIREK
ncbi:MAG: hypothetical protein OXC26_26045 [Albidovulum sp.]|nr:hypothetical protein [Albidovulum sp.]